MNHVRINMGFFNHIGLATSCMHWAPSMNILIDIVNVTTNCFQMCVHPVQISTLSHSCTLRPQARARTALHARSVWGDCAPLYKNDNANVYTTKYSWTLEWVCDTGPPRGMAATWLQTVVPANTPQAPLLWGMKKSLKARTGPKIKHVERNLHHATPPGTYVRDLRIRAES